MRERIYWLGFSLFPGIGPSKFAKLLSYFGSAYDAWHASLMDLQASKIGNNLAEEFIIFRQTQSVEQYAEALHKKNVSYLTLFDEEYPLLLKQIKNPPFVLYCKGDFDFHSLAVKKTIGVVGTRRITEYGRHVTQLFTQDLVGAGCVIVSGLALGVDAVAHRTTLDGGGETIAVLGCGVDCCYPRENEVLYNDILEKGGVIVSEYPPGMEPTKGSFPSRNRIIAGLSAGVLVTEGAAQSGSLITANDAVSNGRDVFAVPGPINSTFSSGPYQLIQQGATLVTSAKELLKAIGMQQTKKVHGNQRVKGDSVEEQQIIDLLQQENLHVDELIKRTNFDSSHLGALLSLMEMKGLISQLDAGFFGIQNSA